MNQYINYKYVTLKSFLSLLFIPVLISLSGCEPDASSILLTSEYSLVIVVETDNAPALRQTVEINYETSYFDPKVYDVRIYESEDGRYMLLYTNTCDFKFNTTLISWIKFVGRNECVGFFIHDIDDSKSFHFSLETVTKDALSGYTNEGTEYRYDPSGTNSGCEVQVITRHSIFGGKTVQQVLDENDWILTTTKTEE
jgi:hypothetical protein